MKKINTDCKRQTCKMYAKFLDGCPSRDVAPLMIPFMRVSRFLLNTIILVFLALQLGTVHAMTSEHLESSYVATMRSQNSVRRRSC